MTCAFVELARQLHGQNLTGFLDSVSVHIAVNQRLECSFSPLSLPFPSLPRDQPRCWVSLSLTKVNGISSQWQSKAHVLRERDTQAWTRTHLSVKGNVVSVQTGLALALLWCFLVIEVETQLKSLISNTCPRVLLNYFYAFLGSQFLFQHSSCSVRTTFIGVWRRETYISQRVFR